jgi:hypothetical protein
MPSHRSLSRKRFVEALAPTPKTRTEYEKRKRLIAHGDATIVVEWLNAANGTPIYRRVLAVRKELEELGAMLDSLTKQRQETRARRPRTSREIADVHREMEKSAKIQERFRKRHNALNRILTLYTHTPALAYSVETGIWRFGMVPKRGSGREIKLSDRQFAVRINQSSVVAALARLAASHELIKVRLCDYCRKRWVFARRPKFDRFCSDDCRVSFHVHSEEGKRNHRKAQAEYRSRLREKAGA